MKTNCLLYALALYWRRRGKAVRRYIFIRKSDMTVVPHFLYGEERHGKVRLVSYKPINPRRRTCPPPIFEGRPRWGDPLPMKPA